MGAALGGGTSKTTSTGSTVIDTSKNISQLLELWGVKEIVKWLEQSDMRVFIPYIEYFNLPGDSVVDLESELFNLLPTLSVTIPGSSTPSDEDITKLSKALSVLEGEYNPTMRKEALKDAIKIAGIQMSKFPSYNLTTLFGSKDSLLALNNQSKKLEFIEFFHQKTRNTLNNGGSRNTRREWINQPRVWRRYWGAYPIIQLSPPISTPTCFNTGSSNNKLKSAIEFIIWNSFSVSGSKGPSGTASNPKSAWSKRCNPSSGGLHPVEIYWFFPPSPSSSSSGTSQDSSLSLQGVFHYSVRGHLLECRRPFSETSNFSWKNFLNLFSLKKSFKKRIVSIVAITTVEWREVWKYGERGWRYCQLDVGHAIGSLLYSIELNEGMKGLVCTSKKVSDKTIKTEWLGINPKDDSSEKEDLNCFIIIYSTKSNKKEEQEKKGEEKGKKEEEKKEGEKEEDEKVNEQKWRGIPSIISKDRITWEMVDWMGDICEFSPASSSSSSSASTSSDSQLKKPKKDTKKQPTQTKEMKEIQITDKVIRSRRSALSYNSKFMKQTTFFNILHHLLPDQFPFSYFQDTQVRIPILAVYISRVENVLPGYYLLIRHPNEAEYFKTLQKQIENNFKGSSNYTCPFLFERIEGCPLPLYLLEAQVFDKDSGDSSVQKQASMASCFQDISKTSCFTIGMICDVADSLRRVSEVEVGREYKKIHWEAGVVGHVLYLMSEERRAEEGLGCTGIGCFVDDLAIHRFGLGKKPKPKRGQGGGEGEEEEEEEENRMGDFVAVYYTTVGVIEQENPYLPYEWSNEKDLVKLGLEHALSSRERLVTNSQ